MKIILFLSLIVFFNITVFAEEEVLDETNEELAAGNMLVDATTNRKCDFTIKCQLLDKEINFEYKALGETCDEALPGQLVLLTEKKRTPLAIKGLSLKKAEDVGNLPSLCEVNNQKYPALQINENRIALFMKIDMRPSYDRLGVLIVDLKKNKLIKLETNLGDIKNRFLALIKTSDGVKTRIIKEYLKSVKCDCDAAFADEWKEINITADSIKSKWEKQ